MAQRSLMRFLSRRDGKNTISSEENNEKVKQIRLLEFVQTRDPEQAKCKEYIRFMYYEPGYPNGDAAAYWMQGKLKNRLDKYEVARKSNWIRNRFKVHQLEVIKCWGTRGTIPDEITVNLTRSTIWALGTEVSVSTEEDEVIAFEDEEICVTKDETDETEGELPTDDEDTTPNLRVLEPSIQGSDSESLARIKMESNGDRDDASSVISTISDDVCEARKLRTLDLTEYLTDERAQEIIVEVSRLLESEENIHARREILKNINEVIEAAQEGLDLAFIAGTLSTTKCTAREDSTRYRERLSEDEAAAALTRAKAGLKKALGMTNKLEKDKFKIIRQWLRYDDDTASITVMFFERVRKDIKRSLKVTMEKMEHSGSLGARRKTTTMPQMYPTLPTEAEMTEEDKTLKWVNDTSNLRHKVKTVSISGTTQEKAQAETSQTSGRHPGADTIHSAPPSYDGHQPEHATQKVQSSTLPNITQTEAIQKEKTRIHLENRRIPSEIWSYYLEKTDMWDYNDLNEEGLHNGIIAIFISPYNIVPWLVRD